MSLNRRPATDGQAEVASADGSQYAIGYVKDEITSLPLGLATEFRNDAVAGRLGSAQPSGWRLP